MRQGKRRFAALAGSLLIALVTFAPAVAQPGQSHPPGNEAFQRTWARTDYPVQELQAQRTWMWGPSAFTTTMNEPYEDTMTGVRTVQYFDKSRMEINNPNADPNALWYVTNGLLVILAKLVSRGVFDRDDLKAFSDSYSKPLDHVGMRENELVTQMQDQMEATLAELMRYLSERDSARD